MSTLSLARRSSRNSRPSPAPIGAVRSIRVQTTGSERRGGQPDSGWTDSLSPPPLLPPSPLARPSPSPPVPLTFRVRSPVSTVVVLPPCYVNHRTLICRPFLGRRQLSGLQPAQLGDAIKEPRRVGISWGVKSDIRAGRGSSESLPLLLLPTLGQLLAAPVAPPNDHIAERETPSAPVSFPPDNFTGASAQATGAHRF